MKTANALEFKDSGEGDPIADVAKELAELKVALETKAANDNSKLTERLDRLEAKLNRPNNRPANDNEPGLETKALNKFLRNGVGALDDLERKTLNLGTNTAGGYVVTPEYGKTVLEKLRRYSPLRGLASAMTIGTTEVYIPTLETDADGEGWVTETGNRTSTEPVFGQLNIKTFENARYIPISQQLLEDADIDLLSFVAGHIAKITGKVEAKSFMIGDGNGKPTGLLNTPTNYASITAAPDGSDIVGKLIDAFYALPGEYAANGSWIMRRETMGLIRKVADAAVGSIGYSGPIWSDGLANGTPATLLGRPVYESVDMSLLPTASGTTYPVVFGDMESAYQIVDRVGLAIRVDDLTGADNGVVKVRWRRRVGGAPLLNEAAVLIKSTKP
ncbi:phage major capsid protein [Bradyrhizobium sp. CB2312]|uniref:phage major capsid protein n=1 Tax=Bradyrhizobium sp. CB2312 TaxID=3039155 RepID=UPI0024B04B02|nr:phage major capsid protein [Bradyrhizobium sp. CB2312]WFU76591.1 phage major capsid protein [Bradyrhizobium sp. CB2312]